MYNAKSQPMDGGANKLRRTGNFEKIGLHILSHSNILHTCVVASGVVSDQTYVHAPA